MLGRNLRGSMIALRISFEDNMDLFNELATIVNDATADAEKFYGKGNKAAGTRVRKAMQEIKRLAQEIRVDVQSKKNTD